LLVVLIVVVVLAGSQAALAGKGPAFRYTLVGHVGGKGAGRGQFSGVDDQGPGPVALDQVCGDVYISDYARNVVHHYDQSGNFIDDIGSAGTGRGQLGSPEGLFVRDAVVQPENPLGPPRRCQGAGFLWVADPEDRRISVFDPKGSLGGIVGKGVQAVWCTDNTVNTTVCDIVRGGDDGFDYEPQDIWVVGDSVYVMGRLGNTVRQYTLNGGFVSSTPSLNDGHYSLAAWGIDLWATYGDKGSTTVALFGLNGSGTTIPLVHVFTWKNTGDPFEGASAIATGIDGKLYVLDRAGLQVFSPRATLLSTTPLPVAFSANQLAVRYDGTVYITGARGYGANIYSPGPLVTLSRQSFSKTAIVLAGRVWPSHAHDRIVLQRSEGNGWNTMATLTLDGRSQFVYRWKPPRRLVHYSVRAYFPDPHPYHADRESQILVVSTS
jgi:hypothetical protein